MADEMVLVEKETGDEWKFTDRSEYLAAKYSGGYRVPAAAPRAPSARQESVTPQEAPRPEPRRRERREPVNDEPTVETPPSE